MDPEELFGGRQTRDQRKENEKGMYNGLNKEKRGEVLKCRTRDIIHYFCLTSIFCVQIPSHKPHHYLDISETAFDNKCSLSPGSSPFLYLPTLRSYGFQIASSYLKLGVCLKLLLRLNIPKQTNQHCEICEIFIVHYLYSVILILPSRIKFNFVFLFIDFVFNLL